MSIKSRLGTAKQALKIALTAKFSLVMVLAMPGAIAATTAAQAQPEWVAGQAAPFHLQADDPQEREQATHCLAQAIYYEAGFQPIEGQRAVAQVIVNRVRDPNFPQTICGVVYQGWERRTGCQFTFVCDGSLVRRPPTEIEMAEATGVADAALNGYVQTQVGTATHYHTESVDPYWRKTLVEVAKVGDHIFYRWPGHAGEPDALTAPYEGDEVAVWEGIGRRGKA